MFVSRWQYVRQKTMKKPSRVQKWSGPVGISGADDEYILE
jgi:hypothetical protein